MDAFDNYQRSERWFRLVSLIDYAGRQLCKEVLHSKESFSRDGRQLYVELEPYKVKMQYREQKLILCPSNGITDETKFDIALYTSLIQVMFGSKYDALIKDLRDKRNELHHMANKNMSQSDFDKHWHSTWFMLKGHGFNKVVADLKTGNLLSNRNLEKILGFIERQTEGRV